MPGPGQSGFEMAETDRGTIGDLERALVERDFAKAFDTLASLLKTMGRTGGIISPDNVRQLSAAFPQDIQEEAATRLAAAIAELFSAAEFQLNALRFRSILPLHRHLSTIFAASGFGNSDFVLQRLGFVPTAEAIKSSTISDLFKLCLLYSYESAIPLNFQLLFQRSPRLAW